MNRIHAIAPIVLVAVSLASPIASPTFAAQRGQRDRGSQDRDSRDRRNGNDRGAGRLGGRPEAPRESGARQRNDTPRVGVAVPRTAPRVIESSRPAARVIEQRRETPRVVERRREAPRVIEQRRPAPRVIERRPVAPRIAVREYRRPVATRIVVRNHPRYFASRVYAYPRLVGPRPYYRPYYTFRPRFNIGFGLFIGYPVAYPVYYYPYAYAVPVPVPSRTGALSFDITPATAAIYVDGRYMGLAEDYSSTMQPLSLEPGLHRVEIHEAGYDVIAFDADVIAGQVIPFHGVMEPQ